MRTLTKYLGMIMELDRSKEVEQLVATVLGIADPGMKKKKFGWQIRTAIEEWRRRANSNDEFFTNLEQDPRFRKSIKRLIPDLEA